MASWRVPGSEGCGRQSHECDSFLLVLLIRVKNSLKPKINCLLPGRGVHLYVELFHKLVLTLTCAKSQGLIFKSTNFIRGTCNHNSSTIFHIILPTTDLHHSRQVVEEGVRREILILIQFLPIGTGRVYYIVPLCPALYYN